MMIKRIRNIISITMIVTMLITTTGVGIYHHICNIEGVHNTSLFTKTECEMEKESCCCKDMESLHENSGCSVEEMDHCFDYLEYRLLEFDYISAAKLNLKAQEVELAYQYLQVKNEINLSEDYYIKNIPIIDFKTQVQSQIEFIKQFSLNKNPESDSDFINS